MSDEKIVEMYNKICKGEIPITEENKEDIEKFKQGYNYMQKFIQNLDKEFFNLQ